MEGYQNVVNSNLSYLNAWDKARGLDADNPDKDTKLGSITGNICNDETTLDAAIDRINGANITYGIFGPNSNSVLRYLISQIPSLKIKYVPFGAWGYSTKLPGIESKIPTPAKPSK